MPTFPLTLPSSPSFSNFQMEGKSAVAVSESVFSAKQQVYAHPAQWWEVSFDLPPLSKAQSAEWAATMLRLNGQEGYFYLTPPDESPIASVSGTITVDAISGYNIDLSGITGTLTAGDWIQIEDGLYRVTVGATSNSSNEATIEVWPKPRADIVAATSTVEYSSPKGRFRMFGSFKWDMDLAKTYGITIGAREVV